MSHTGEDILDLYKSLAEVGLSETPREEAERLRKEFIEGIGTDAFYSSSAWEEFLSSRGVPHTFGFILHHQKNRIDAFRVFTIIRGYCLLKRSVLPFDEASLWAPSIEGAEAEFESGFTLDQMEEKVASLNERFHSSIRRRVIRIPHGVTKFKSQDPIESQ